MLVFFSYTAKQQQQLAHTSYSVHSFPLPYIRSLVSTTYRSTFSRTCGGRRHALYYAYSKHSNVKEDRIWRFKCKKITNVNFKFCYWSEYLNSFDKPLLANCRTDFVMTGIYSKYSAPHRDRIFKIRCCSACNRKTRSCSLSNFVNDWDRVMHYSVIGRRVFTGIYSYHENSKE